MALSSWKLCGERRELRSAGQTGASAPTQARQIHFFGAGGERMRCCRMRDRRRREGPGRRRHHRNRQPSSENSRTLSEAHSRGRREAPGDLAVVIDSPAFNWRVARQMRKRGIPVVYYVCPQFWAWRQGRVKIAAQVRQQGAGDFSLRRKVLSRSRSGRHVRRPSAGRPARTDDFSRRHTPPSNRLDPAKLGSR